MVGQPSQGAVHKFSAKRMIAASFKFLARATGMGKPHNVLMAPVRIAFTADPLLRFGLETFSKNGIARLNSHIIAENVQNCCRHRHCRSEEHTSELQSLMRISYAVFCL